MVRKTGVQSQVESFQKLKKWYLMAPCLTLTILRYSSRIMWSNPRKEVATQYFAVVAIEKGTLKSVLTSVTIYACLVLCMAV